MIGAKKESPASAEEFSRKSRGFRVSMILFVVGANGFRV